MLYFELENELKFYNLEARVQIFKFSEVAYLQVQYQLITASFESLLVDTVDKISQLKYKRLYQVQPLKH